MEEKNNNFKILLIFTTFLTTFILWYLVSYKVDIFSLKIEDNISSIEQNLKSKIIDLNTQKNLDLDLFWRVYNIIDKNYYSKSSIEKKNLEYWIIKWLVDSLWDKHSEFLIPEDTKIFLDSLSWDFEWIWAVIEKHDFWVIIDRVLAWSPALEWWLLKWDIIVEANEVQLQDLSVREAVEYIKWPAWTVVNLKIIRSWEPDFIYKEITRQKITIPSVESRDLEKENIWYIILSNFWEHTSEEFKNILNEFKNDDNIEGIIIDLRDNWGWYLQSAIDITSEFLQKGDLIVETKYRDDFYNNKYTSTNKWSIFNKKIVILINWNSASASEIMAWALRDYKKAILVWTKTYWKWSVQQPFELPDGSLLKLTIAKWYTPSWHSIEWNWIEPDIKVELTRQDYQEKNDRQLNTAIEVLESYIKNNSIWIVLEEFNYEEIDKESQKDIDDEND